MYVCVSDVCVCVSPVHSLDELPGVCGQVQHPKVFIVVELLPVRRGKLPPEHPQLPPSLRDHHRLVEGEWWGGVGRGGAGTTVCMYSFYANSTISFELCLGRGCPLLFKKEH